MSDYRSVVLTSHIMKILESLMLAHLKPLVKGGLNPLPFAYQANIGVEDVIIYMLHVDLVQSYRCLGVHLDN